MSFPKPGLRCLDQSHALEFPNGMLHHPRPFSCSDWPLRSGNEKNNWMTERTASLSQGPRSEFCKPYLGPRDTEQNAERSELISTCHEWSPAWNTSHPKMGANKFSLSRIASSSQTGGVERDVHQ